MADTDSATLDAGGVKLGDGFEIKVETENSDSNRPRAVVNVYVNGVLVANPYSVWLQDGRLAGDRRGVSADHCHPDADGFLGA